MVRFRKGARSSGAFFACVTDDLPAEGVPPIAPRVGQLVSLLLITRCVNNVLRYHRLHAAIVPGQRHRGRLAPKAITQV